MVKRDPRTAGIAHELFGLARIGASAANEADHPPNEDKKKREAPASLSGAPKTDFSVRPVPART